MKNSIAVRNAELDAYEATVGASPLIKFFFEAEPANCGAADAGSARAAGTLPADWMGAAAAGVKSKAGAWTLTGQVAAGTGTDVTHYRIYDAAGTTCHEQGSVTVTGGGGNIEVDNVNIANNQVVTITGWTRTAGNA